MIIKVSVPGRFQFKAVPSFKTMFLQKQGEIHYIGGADILPPPLDGKTEALMIGKLGTEEDKEAKSTLIEHNLRLVVYIAKKFDNTSVGVEDLISIGTIGLIKAINTFDPSKKIKLATYASRCIENEIRMQFRRNRKTGGTVSLQEALESDGDSALTLADVLQDSFCMEDTCETQDDIRRMRQLLDGLPARERQIILLRYGLSGQPPLTQLETAKLLDISRSYVSRLETHALELLRQRWDVPGTKTAQR